MRRVGRRDRIGPVAIIRICPEGGEIDPGRRRHVGAELDAAMPSTSGVRVEGAGWVGGVLHDLVTHIGLKNGDRVAGARFSAEGAARPYFVIERPLRPETGIETTRDSW